MALLEHTRSAYTGKVPSGVQPIRAILRLRVWCPASGERPAAAHCRPCPEGRSSRTPGEPAGMALRVTSACCGTAAAGGAPPPTRAVSEHQLSFQQRRRLVASSLSFSELLGGRGLRVAAAAARRADPGRHAPLCGIWRAARKTGLPPCNLVPADSCQVTNSSLKSDSFGVCLKMSGVKGHD